MCKKFKNLIYKDATIYLHRKYEIFNKMNEPYKKYKYKGVHFNKQVNKWMAQIYVNKDEPKRYLGLFDSEIEAVKAYNEEARKLGEKEQIIDE